MAEELPHGWTLQDLARIARNAVSAQRGMILDWVEGRDVAASAMVEKLYAAPESTRDDLFFAARNAVNSANKLEISHCGLWTAPHRSGREGQSRNFATYWYGHDVLIGQFEDRVVDRIAALQVWSGLSERERQTLRALMTEGTYEGAATLLGISHTAWKTRLSLARRHARELWHWPEEPSRQWALDRRVDNGRAVHGTRILAHRRRAARYSAA
jgi:hypothetical protein